MGEGRGGGGAVGEGAVRLSRRGHVATVLFDRPAARNALTWPMYAALEEGLERLAGEEGVRAVVLRGAGGAFVAGTDIAHFRGFESGEDGIRYERRLDGILARLEALPVPTLAVVEGAAVGGGLAIAAACDLRICTPDARFGVPIARTVGNCLSAANHARLVAHLGPARTKALLLLAQLMGAEEAREAGFVFEVVDPDALERRVQELCARIASHAPITLEVTKEAIRRLAERGGERGTGEADHDDLIRRAYGSSDFREGVRAFLGKRKPRWEGR